MSLIKCQQLSRRYGSHLALDNINLDLTTGQPIALVGPNGAGKTTLFSLLLGYIHPSAGSIEVFGLPPGHPQLRSKIGALPQDAKLDPDFTLEQQLSLFAQLRGMSAKAAKQEALRVLTLVDLADSLKQKPTTLSHGMSKRVAIAQALIGEPELILLDEPTAGIDPANARLIRDLISKLSDRTTFVVSSHNLDELERLCDQVVFLERGQVKQQVSLSATTETQYFTLQLQAVDDQTVLSVLRQLPDVLQVNVASQHAFVIEYQPSATALDVALLQLCHQQGWRYRLLLNGRSLEDTLFAQ
ncbi:ABC transporter ATP-binding protein [Shewanella sp. C32]|uniref:ABC transporter ATP-binding protein n=1 Tax=Shewanella electrica TaxID=515560 RepID=A0ABT2FNU6_9GAMM|nr:ABC transporter ATP-binding protein [Shewanella electrica]MCH1926725.1 ABC transporter ATP-binding protein [Shewanella electrica]MCS4558014.1 ABC transporter ATP-binding protein [Shewanella electrica]